MRQPHEVYFYIHGHGSSVHCGMHILCTLQTRVWNSCLHAQLILCPSHSTWIFITHWTSSAVSILHVQAPTWTCATHSLVVLWLHRCRWLFFCFLCLSSTPFLFHLLVHLSANQTQDSLTPHSCSVHINKTWIHQCEPASFDLTEWHRGSSCKAYLSDRKFTTDLTGIWLTKLCMLSSKHIKYSITNVSRYC